MVSAMALGVVLEVLKRIEVIKTMLPRKLEWSYEWL
ncbi:MAG: hypothetical protein RIQ88_1033 [Actinomycetota bacterium]